MMQPLPIGLLAGLGSALLFASAASGTPVAALLFYAAPLPLFVAGLGFGQIALLAAVLVSSLASGLILGLWVGAVFAASVAIPSGLLARLTLLSRPVDASDPAAGVEWYPVGRVVLWAAGLGALVLSLTVPVIGLGERSYHDELSRIMSALLESGRGSALVPEGVDLDRLAAVLSVVLPPAAAAMWTATTLVNYWIATRIVAASGRLPRPSPKLSELEYPPKAAVLFVAAIAASFLPGTPGLLASFLSATLFVAFLLLGLATIHQLTEGSAHRALILAATYLALLVLSWTAILVAAFGVVENVLALRMRSAARRASTKNRSSPPEI